MSIIKNSKNAAKDVITTAGHESRDTVRTTSAEAQEVIDHTSTKLKDTVTHTNAEIQSTVSHTNAELQSTINHTRQSLQELGDSLLDKLYGVLLMAVVGYAIYYSYMLRNTELNIIDLTMLLWSGVSFICFTIWVSTLILNGNKRLLIFLKNNLYAYALICTGLAAIFFVELLI